MREYIWLPEAQIAPVKDAIAPVDRPLAVVSAVNTTPVYTSACTTDPVSARLNNQAIAEMPPASH